MSRKYFGTDGVRGTVGQSPMTPDFVMRLGYAAGKTYAGNGYMREGIDLVLRRAFADLKLHRIEANIQPGNATSLALAGGAGFRREGFSPRYLKIGGRWRDHERWAILVEEWVARTGEPPQPDGPF